MDIPNILTRNIKRVKVSAGEAVLIEMVAANFLRFMTSFEANTNEWADLLADCITGVEIKDITPHDAVNVLVPALIELHDFDVIYTPRGATASASRDAEDSQDATLFLIIDRVAVHYGTDPFSLMQRATLRQIMYMFTLAYNRGLDAIYSQGGKVGDCKHPPHLNARGLVVDEKTLPAEQRAKRIRRRAEGRKRGE